MLVGAVMTANISAGCCSAALEAEAELWAGPSHHGSDGPLSTPPHTLVRALT